MSYYRRPIPVLPPADSLPFPANFIRLCSDCGLRTGCTAPVPAENVNPCEVLLCGEAPGFNEDREGRPFCGQAGRYLDSLLFQSCIPRESICITNVVHCRPPNNRTPKANEVKSCAKWLDIELGLVRPRIVVAMGAPAIARFLGSGAGTVEHLHGRPIEVNGRIILPSYHPAAALHDTSKIRQCQEDFAVLHGLVKGRSAASYAIRDEYPNPDYRIAEGDSYVKMVEQIRDAGEFAVDTEQCRGKLWSVQISAEPGTGWFIPVLPEQAGNRFNLKMFNADAIVHYYLHDIKYLDMADDRFLDTMTFAYLLGLPQGLKELAARLCGIQMVNYSEMVRPGQHKIALDYLTEASKREWPEPPTIEETKWDNKKGRLTTKAKKPWHISRKIAKVLSDLAADSGVDLFQRWRAIPDEERAAVEKTLGAMPEAALSDIPLEDAVQYAVRDSDACLRVKRKMDSMIADLGLDFVLHMDLAILPMVDAMMRNGMAVDLDHYHKLSEDYDIRMRVKAAELAGIVGHPFNPASSPQVAAVVYQELGFKPTKQTPGGDVSTDDAELKKTGHPVAKGIIQYRGILKLKSTYADNIIRSAHPDENGVPRMHTKLNTTRVETGRLSSSKDENGEGTNLQNIPTRNKESKAIKRGFIAPNGWVLVEGDLAQVEMRTQAHLARCKGLIDLFLSGRDPHTTTASKLFGIPYDQASQSKYRYPCKRAGFGIIYMIGAKGLSTQINEYIADLEMEGEPVDVDPWDETTCQKFIDDYYKLYPEIRDYQQEMLAHARRYGYVQDMFGRIRYIPEVTCPLRHIQEAGARMAANMPVTASAQGILKIAMGRLWRELPKTPWVDKALVLMQIHDSMLYQLRDHEDVVKPFLCWMKYIVCHSVQLAVPVDMDFKAGHSWADLAKVKLEE